MVSLPNSHLGQRRGPADLPPELRGDRRLVFDDHDHADGVVRSVENWDVIEAMKTVSCPAGYDAGDLGRRFARFVEGARRTGELKRYFAPAVRPGDQGRVGFVVSTRWAERITRWTPLGFHPAWRRRIGFELWDRKTAGLIEPGMECLVGFAGAALHSFRAARHLGCGRLELVATPGDLDAPKTRAECAMADLIWCPSEDVRQTLARAGLSERKLREMNNE